MLDFLRRNRILLVSALCLLLAAGVARRATQQPGQTDQLSRFFLEVMAPLQGVTASIGQSIGDGWRHLADLWGAREENARLQQESRRLAQELDRLTEIELENARLRRLLDFRDSLHGDLLTARVIGRDATGLARTLLVDRGEADGVTKGAAALAPEGIVGQVFFASQHAARILLVSDHNSGVDALVQRTRARGIVQGTMESGCGLKYVKRTEDVQVGDTVITSGLDGIFPKGLSIGQVITVDKRGQGLFQSAEVAPRVDFDQLEEVLLTRGKVVPAEPPVLPPVVPLGPPPE